LRILTENRQCPANLWLQARPAGEQYSTERLSKTVSLHLQQNAIELIETIYTSVIEFRTTTSLADDLTLVLLKKL